MSRLRTLTAAVATAVIATAGVSVATAGPPTTQNRASASNAPNAAAPQATSGGVKTAYFTQWGIYANGFYPKNLISTGVAGKLDFLNYAFANIHPTSHTCFMANHAASQDETNPNAGDGAGDAFADYGKSYGADISVDGVGDVWNQPIQGNFNQLRKLKRQFPNLKMLISIGGWTYSKYFSDAASTATKRQQFVSSCVDMFLKGNLPVVDGFGGPGSAAGLFDGVDLDWEYPSSPTPTPTPTPPTPTPTPTPTPSPTPPKATPWAPNTAYATGSLVSYNGITYRCIQGHTSQTGWEPPNVPALWGTV
jgi:chitinase